MSIFTILPCGSGNKKKTTKQDMQEASCKLHSAIQRNKGLLLFLLLPLFLPPLLLNAITIPD